MEAQGMFRNAFPVLEKALDVRAFRHTVILSNLANADTPQYKPFEVLVREEMEKVGPKPMPLRCLETHPDHLSGVLRDEGGVAEEKDKDDMLVLRADKNKVDMEEEVTNLAENQILYNAMAQILSRKFEGLRTAIYGGRR